MPDGPVVVSTDIPEAPPDGSLYGRTNTGTTQSWQLCVPNAGGVTMTGPLVLNADPTAAYGACTKNYADTFDVDDGFY